MAPASRHVLVGAFVPVHAVVSVGPLVLPENTLLTIHSHYHVCKQQLDAEADGLPRQ